MNLESRVITLFYFWICHERQCMDEYIYFEQNICYRILRICIRGKSGIVSVNILQIIIIVYNHYCLQIISHTFDNCLLE